VRERHVHREPDRESARYRQCGDQNPGGDAAGVEAGECATLLAAAKAAAAAETTKQAAAVAQAAVAAAVVLRAEMEREPEPVARMGAAASYRHQSGVAVATGAPRCCRQSTATPE
jgi:hypothetical protein